jgi:hypothetical protein
MVLVRFDWDSGPLHSCTTMIQETFSKECAPKNRKKLEIAEGHDQPQKQFGPVLFAHGILSNSLAGSSFMGSPASVSRTSFMPDDSFR